MSISCNSLWKLLIDKGISKSTLRKMTGISPNTMTKLNKNEQVAISVLLRICFALDADMEDIIEVVHQNELTPED